MKKTIALSVIVLLFAALPFPSLGDQLSDAQSRKNKIDNQISAIGQQKTQTQKALKKVETQKEQLEDAEAANGKRYQDMMTEYKAVETQIAEMQKAINASEEEYNRQKDLYAKRLKAMYETSGVSALEILLDSKSIMNFFERLEFLSKISEKDTKLMQEIDASKKDQEVKKMEMEIAKQELSQRAQDLQKNIQVIKASRAEKDAQIDKLSISLDEYEKREDELISMSAELASSIQSLLNKNTKYASGAMVWPAPASHLITSSYGYRYHPILHVNKLHTGIDIGAAYGTPILAAQKGTVVLSGWQNAYGNTVIIDHGGGIATMYAHASKLLVKAGTKVNAGTVIARVGSTGWSTGAHLHFEVIVNGKTVNPLNYIK